MLIIEVKEGESIDRALKRYKRKHRNTKVRQELMERKFFTKPSVKRRHEILDAIYRQEREEKMDQH
ncbi:MAG: 30S ribosomal protein S21 [Bacteroidetes bacterium]|nr:30S ribosomal protein S21 [Bacteroidota bacterium]